MGSFALSNYLKTFRKLSGFSQDDIAFLLGYEDHSAISRYERSVQLPDLEAIFSYSTIFQIDVPDLFPGIRRKVEAQTVERIHNLIHELAGKQSDPLIQRKLNVLKTVASAVFHTRHGQHQ